MTEAARRVADNERADISVGHCLCRVYIIYTSLHACLPPSSPSPPCCSSTTDSFSTMRSLITLATIVLPFVSAKPASSTRTCSNHGKGHKSSLVSAAWYAGWHSADFPLDTVRWDKYTHMTYSFA